MPDLDDVLEALTDADIEDALGSHSPQTDADIETAFANISFRVIYQTHNYLLPQLRDLIENREVLNLRPEYQRRLRWSNKQKSLLIESLFLNIPIPPIFLYESDAARYEVMDGQQRLNSIHSYLMNDFNLIGLEKLSFLNGRSYRRLPPKLKRALDRASVSAIVLLQETRSDHSDPFLVRRLVFERLNTGGQKLNPQEMRNSIYRGRFNDLIVRLARNNSFCELFNIPLYTETDENEYYENPDRQKNSLYRSMGDCQIVLRFFALSKDENITGSMRSILDKEMNRNKSISEDEADTLKSQFIDAISNVEPVFGSDAFLLNSEGGGSPRHSIALYDAVMGALLRRANRISDLRDRSATIQANLTELKRDRRDLLTGQANTAQAIKDRINAVVQVMDAVL